MIAGYISNQLDFLSALSGLALWLLAIAFVTRPSRALWGFPHGPWLVLFAVTQGTAHWLEIPGLGYGPLRGLDAVRLALTIASFLFLWEFGRCGAETWRARRLPLWSHLPPLALLLAIALEHPSGGQAAARCTLGLAASMLAGLSVFYGTGGILARWSRHLVAVLLGAYGLAVALTPPLVESAIILALALVILLAKEPAPGFRTKSLRETLLYWSWPAALGLIVLVGWVATNAAGHAKDKDERERVLNIARGAAAALETENLSRLRGSPEDLGTTPYLELKDQAARIRQSNPNYRFVYLLEQGKEHPIFLVDGEPDASPDCSPPGQAYTDAPPQLRQAFKERQPVVSGPYQDRWGVWVSAFVPVYDRTGDCFLAMMGIDIRATHWSGMIYRRRAEPICVTLLVCLLLLGFYVARQRMGEYLTRITDSEKKYEALIEASPNCIQLFDADGYCLSVNEHGRRALGLSLPEVVGRRFTDLWPDEERSIVAGAVCRACAGEGNSFEANYRRPDGRVIRWLVVVQPLEASQKAVGRFVTIGMDVTHIRQSEESARQNSMALLERLRTEEEIAACARALLENADPHQAISGALQHLLLAADAGRAYVFENFEDPTEGLCMRQSHEACAPGVAPAIDDPLLQRLPYRCGFTHWAKELRAGRNIEGHVRDFPEDIRAILESQDIKSVLILPLWIEGQWYGFIGFDETRRERCWRPEEVRILQTGAAAIGSYLVRKHSEEALEESREYLNGILNSIGDPIFVKDEQHRFVLVNEAQAALAGITRTQFIGKQDAEFFPADRVRVFWERDDRVLATGEPDVSMEKITDAQGRVRDIVTKKTRYVARSGERFIVGVIRDITELKQAEQKLRDSEARFRSYFESPLVGLAIMSPQKGWIEANDRLCAILGYTREELTHFTWDELTHPDDLAADVAEFERVLAGEIDSYSLEKRFIRKDGSTIHAELAVRCVRGGRGAVDYYVAVIEDITERKHAEQAIFKSNTMMAEALRREKSANRQLEATMEQLEAVSRDAQAANLAKSQFLANVSHEIRTPMTAILGYVELLSDGCTHECEFGRSCFPEHAAVITRNSHHLLQVINDILDLSKIEAGKMDIERMACSARGILLDVERLLKPRALAKGLAFVVETQGPIPDTIRSDPTRLRQILLNLVGNAVKFTETGQVRLVMYLTDRNGRAFEPESTGGPATPSGAPCLLRFDISDSGIGMSRDVLDHLFQPFSQGDAATSRRFGGTGLGLTISRRLAEMLGGTITVESEAGQGSVFHLTITTGPLEGVPLVRDVTVHASETKAAGTKTAHTASLSGRILLAEDGPDNQRLIGHVLRKAGADVTIADNGRIAVNQVHAAEQAGRPFQLILMDMQMPELDGYSATRLLRESGRTLPIIALTAHAMTSDRQKCIEAGCTDYASKPIDRAKLLQMIAHHLAQSPGSSNGTPHSDKAATLPAFLNEQGANLAKLEEMLAAGNLAAFAEAAHALKDRAAAVNASPLARLAEQLEQVARTQQDLELLKTQMTELRRLIENPAPVPQPNPPVSG